MSYYRVTASVHLDDMDPQQIDSTTLEAEDIGEFECIHIGDGLSIFPGTIDQCNAIVAAAARASGMIAARRALAEASTVPA